MRPKASAIQVDQARDCTPIKVPNRALVRDVKRRVNPGGVRSIPPVLPVRSQAQELDFFPPPINDRLRYAETWRSSSRRTWNALAKLSFAQGLARWKGTQITPDQSASRGSGCVVVTQWGREIFCYLSVHARTCRRKADRRVIVRRLRLDRCGPRRRFVEHEKKTFFS
jgi:hypothetical protein